MGIARILILGLAVLISVGCDNSESKLNSNVITKPDVFTHLKYSFYQDKKGNLFEKKNLAIESLDDEGKYFYDSTMYFGEYPNRIALKMVVDIKTFEELEDSPFSRDKNNVYYVQATSSGHKRFIIENANPASFMHLNYRWGKDDSCIFWQTEIVEGADLESFEISETNHDSAFDKNSTYKNGQQFKIIDR